MGWSTMNRPRGETNRAFFTKELLGEHQRFLADSTIGGTFYAAVEDQDGVWGLVVLTNRYPRSFYNYGYKAMSEIVGPCESKAPTKVLDFLTPTDNEYANAWRERCRANARHVEIAGSVRVGDLVAFSSPITFTDKATYQEMTIVDKRRNLFTPPGGGRRYRVPQWRYLVRQPEAVRAGASSSASGLTVPWKLRVTGASG